MSPSPKQCEIEGCPAPASSRGWCTKHYTRWVRHGDPLKTLKTPPATDTATEKRCPRCARVKPIEAFDRRANGKPKGYCRECMASYDAAYAATETGREARRNARARWNEGNHEYFLQYRYDLSLAQYNALLLAQGGGCAICQTDAPGGNYTKWAVDHCHDTNRVRGLLCGACNMGLGKFKDDPARLRAAAEYLERHR
jgi:hypothetical protein